MASGETILYNPEDEDANNKEEYPQSDFDPASYELYRELPDEVSEKLRPPNIDDIEDGQQAYVVPWALWVDASTMEVYINRTYTPRSEKGGTSNLNVHRVDGQLYAIVDPESDKLNLTISRESTHHGAKAEDYEPITLAVEKNTYTLEDMLDTIDGPD